MRIFWRRGLRVELLLRCLCVDFFSILYIFFLSLSAIAAIWKTKSYFNYNLMCETLVIIDFFVIYRKYRADAHQMHSSASFSTVVINRLRAQVRTVLCSHPTGTQTHTYIRHTITMRIESILCIKHRHKNGISMDFLDAGVETKTHIVMKFLNMVRWFLSIFLLFFSHLGEWKREWLYARVAMRWWWCSGMSVRMSTMNTIYHCSCASQATIIKLWWKCTSLSILPRLRCRCHCRMHCGSDRSISLWHSSCDSNAGTVWQSEICACDAYWDHAIWHRRGSSWLTEIAESRKKVAYYQFCFDFQFCLLNFQ